MIQLKDVEIGFGTQLLYKGVELFIGEGDKIGLVGPNGSGKTTLLKLIQGGVPYDKGRIVRKKGYRTSYLPQRRVVLKERTVMEEALSVFAHIVSMAEDMRKLESDMRKGRDLDRLLKKYAELQERYEKDAYTYEVKTKKVLSRLGFSEEDFSKSTQTQSGGFQMRIALAKLLLEEPDVMLLDEPTNYLDIKSIEGFENHLKGFRGAFVLVAHDRRLLDQCVTKIWSIENQRVVVDKGNYSFFVRASEKRRRGLEKRLREQQKKIEGAKRFVERFRAKSSTARRARSKERMVAKLERITLPEKPKTVRFTFPEADGIYGKALELKGISKRFGKLSVFGDVDLTIGGSERIAVFGANGQGKTTLLRIIAGHLDPTSGVIWRSRKLKTAFYTQGAEEELEDAKTIFQEIQADAQGYAPSELRNLLGRFLFSGDEINKPIKVLSGGERTRLAILRVLLRPSNFLVLDEPANHLDIRSREILEEAILSYQHTVLFAAHDRHMMDRLAAKTLKIEDGKVTLYLGNYSYATQGRCGLPETGGADAEKPERERENVRIRKKERLRELEVRYEEAKNNLDLQKARELWQEYEMVLREIERLDEWSGLSQDVKDS
jgi:ATP-binding cassette subfamily F protein 3